MTEARRVSMAALLLLPGGLVVYFAFNAGGFYVAPPAFIAVLLCLVLAVRATMASSPFAGLSRLVGLGAGSLALYSLLTLISGDWSHAPGVARIEFDLPLVYVLAMLVFGSIPRTRERLRWMLRGLALAAIFVCTVGLITRLLPHVWPTSPSIANQRLSFPVTYWNVLGLLAALGIALCVHFSSDLREPWIGRVLAAGAVPILASTLYFTFSRGAIAACLIALVAYALIGRPRGLLSSMVAIAPATAVSVKVAYDANLLATINPTSPAAIVQGHHVAVVVLICALAAAALRTLLVLLLDARLRRFALAPHLRRPAAWTGWISIGTAAVIAVVALHGTIARDYQRFVGSGTVGNTTDLRTRLTDPANNTRVQQWKVAWRGFKMEPVLGHGAGTYQNLWARYRTIDQSVLDTHSLYLETLDELGIVGFLLLLTTILAVLVRVASRARGRGRPLYAAVFAVLLTWALHAGVDWDWEMPVVSIIFFSLGGFMLGRRSRPDGTPPSRLADVSSRPWVRVSLALAFLSLAVVPAFTWVSQQKLDNAAYAFSQGDCRTTRQDALSSISVLGNRAEPYEFIAYCDVRMGMPEAALASIEKAVSLDPGDWTYHYDLAVMQAAAGLDPRPAAYQTLMMDPREPLVQAEWHTFEAETPNQWQQEAQNIVYDFNVL